MIQLLSRPALKNPPRRPRGQLMLIGAMFVLLMSFMLMMVLSVSWGVHERIRTQNAADAQAYSQGIHVARAMNYFAYTNRSIAGALVGMSIASAYETEMSAAADLYMSHGLINIAAGFCEIGQCCSCGILGCCKVWHCWHAVEDFWTAAEFLMQAEQVQSDLQDIDPKYKDTIEAYKTMIHFVAESQRLMEVEVGLLLLGGHANLTGTDNNLLNLPRGEGSDSSSVVGALSANNFKNVLNYDRTEKKTKDMADVANAARSGWVRERGNTDDGESFISFAESILILNFGGIDSKISDMDGGDWFQMEPPFGLGGKAGITQGGSLAPSPDTEADGVSSQDMWVQFGSCQHTCCGNFNAEPYPWPISLVMAWFEPAWVNNGADDGDHHGGFLSPHQDGHKLDPDDLFTYMSLEVGTAAPYGQPAVYGYAKHKLEVNEAGGLQPWTITASGKTKPDLHKLHGAIEELNMNGGSTDAGEATAISKALVYYHRPGYWKEPPNLFNPFWRVKLHPFGGTEASKVAIAAGDMDASALSLAADMVDPKPFNIDDDGYSY